MKLAEIEQEALALPDRDRASLAANLLDTLPPPGTDVSDEEVDDKINSRLGDEFWEELSLSIQRAIATPQRFHFEARDRRRVKAAKQAPHHLFIVCCHRKAKAARSGRVQPASRSRSMPVPPGRQPWRTAGSQYARIRQTVQRAPR